MVYESKEKDWVVVFDSDMTLIIDFKEMPAVDNA